MNATEIKAAVEYLASVLYEEMERLDPSSEVPDWDNLSEWEKNFYALCIKAVIKEKEAIVRSLAEISNDE